MRVALLILVALVAAPGCMSRIPRADSTGRVLFQSTAYDEVKAQAAARSRPRFRPGEEAARPPRRGRVRIRPVSSKSPRGFCSEANLRARTRAKRNQIHRCYTDVLQQDSSVQGRITLRWLVGREGKVWRIQVSEDQVHVPQLAECLASVIQSIRYARPDGGTCKVLWPFVFGAR